MFDLTLAESDAGHAVAVGLPGKGQIHQMRRSLVLDKDTVPLRLGSAAGWAAMTTATRFSEVASNGTTIRSIRPLMAVPPLPRPGEGVRPL